MLPIHEEMSIIVQSIYIFKELCFCMMHAYYIKYVYTKTITIWRSYPRELIVQQQRYRSSDSNENIDIQFNVQISWATFIRYTQSQEWKTKYCFF
jgi:hypothetical protein